MRRVVWLCAVVTVASPPGQTDFLHSPLRNRRDGSIIGGTEMQEREHSPSTGRALPSAKRPSAAARQRPTFVHAILLLDLAFCGVMLLRLALGTAFAILGSVFFGPGESLLHAAMFPVVVLAASRVLAVVVDIQGLRGNPRWLTLAIPVLVLWAMGQLGGIFLLPATHPRFAPRDPGAFVAIFLVFVFSALFNMIWLLSVLQLRRRLQEAALWEQPETTAPAARQQSPPVSPEEGH